MNKPVRTSLSIDNRDIYKYKKKQLIYNEGNIPYYLFYVLKGKIKTSKSNNNGKELITSVYKADDFLGYVALMEGTVYKDTAVAIEYTELAIIPKKDFELLISSNMQTARFFIEMMAEKLTEKDQQLVGLAYNCLRKKVADALILLNPIYKDGINLNRNNLAALAGTSTEALIRTLKQFKNELIIDIREGRVLVLNEVKLKRLQK